MRTSECLLRYRLPQAGHAINDGESRRFIKMETGSAIMNMTTPNAQKARNEWPFSFAIVAGINPATTAT
jgi:hypothetical protein